MGQLRFLSIFMSLLTAPRIKNSHFFGCKVLYLSIKLLQSKIESLLNQIWTPVENLQKQLKTLLKKFYGPFLQMGFNCLKATAISRRQFNFYHSVPRNSWCSFYRPLKDEKLSRPWSHPMVLNTGRLDWEIQRLNHQAIRPLGLITRPLGLIALTTRPLVIKQVMFWHFYVT